MNRINYGRIPMVFMYKDSLLSQNYIVTKIWIIQGYKKTSMQLHVKIGILHTSEA